jgi:hypothetical protein
MTSVTARPSHWRRIAVTWPPGVLTREAHVVPSVEYAGRTACGLAYVRSEAELLRAKGPSRCERCRELVRR